MKSINEAKNHRNYLEITTAIFIIAAVSLFVFSNFIVGYNLPIYIFATLFGFALSVFYPRSGIYSVVFLTVIFERFFTLVPIYFNRAEYKIYPLDIIFTGIIIGMVIKVISNKPIQKLRMPDYLVATFILASAAYFIFSSYFLHADFAVSFSTMKNYAFYGLFYFAILFLFNDRKKLITLLKFFFAGAIAIIIFIIIGLVRGEGLWTEFTPLSTPGTRILAFPHAFYLSMAVLVSMVWLSFAKNEKKTLQNTLLILVPIWAVGILGSLMRHLWISLFVSIIFIYWLLPKENRIRLRKIIFHYALIGIIAIIFMSYLSFLFPASDFSKTFAGATGIAGKRFVSTVQVSSDESLNWRKSVWQSTWREYKDNLIFGLGYGKKVSVEIGTKYKDFVEIRNIHNSLLTIFIQMGIWSAVLFSAIVWMLAIPLKKKSFAVEISEYNFLKIAFLAVFLNYLVAFLFQTYLETNLLGIFFWMILGGLAVLNSNHKIES
jgi:O-antigen ligase